MAQVMTPQPSDPEIPLFFNVDGVVGAAPAQNLREDVLLVQFCLRTIGDKPLAQTKPELVAACKQVNVTGVMDAATVNAIRVRQQVAKGLSQNSATMIDGRVSPAKGGYSYGAHWTIVLLNSDLQGRNLDVWPRMDKITGCPPELKTMVTRLVVGK